MIKSTTIFIFLGILSFIATAQSNDAQRKYEEFRQQTVQNYIDFRDKANNEYIDFMKQAWIQYDTLPAIPTPKDKTIPPINFPINDYTKPIKDNEIPVISITPIIHIEPQPLPPYPIKEQPQPIEQYFSFTFFGTIGKVRINNDMQFSLSGNDEYSIADGWRVLSNPLYNNLICDCLSIRKKHNLCDWAYLQMLKEFATAFCGKNTNEATLLAAYIYCQSGYKMRLAIADNRLRLMYASNHFIYNQTYFNIDNYNYYILDSNNNCGNIRICQASYPQEKPLSLIITQNQIFDRNESDKKELRSKRYPDIKAFVSCNKNNIDFFNGYPTSMLNGNFLTRWAMYANTPMNESITADLYPVLQKHISNLSKKEAAERLLNWVQTAFVYGYDNKVWGYDRAFFPEETLYYPYNDCEDRSILFSRLSKIYLT